MESLHTQDRKAILAEETPSEAREQSRLFDACLNAGMSFDEPDHVAWATLRLSSDLVSA